MTMTDAFVHVCHMHYPWQQKNAYIYLQVWMCVRAYVRVWVHGCVRMCAYMCRSMLLSCCKVRVTISVIVEGLPLVFAEILLLLLRTESSDSGSEDDRQTGPSALLLSTPIHPRDRLTCHTEAGADGPACWDWLSEWLCHPPQCPDRVMFQSWPRRRYSRWRRCAQILADRFLCSLQTARLHAGSFVRRRNIPPSWWSDQCTQHHIVWSSVTLSADQQHLCALPTCADFPNSADCRKFLEPRLTSPRLEMTSSEFSLRFPSTCHETKSEGKSKKSRISNWSGGLSVPNVSKQILKPLGSLPPSCENVEDFPGKGIQSAKQKGKLVKKRKKKLEKKNRWESQVGCIRKRPVTWLQRRLSAIDLLVAIVIQSWRPSLGLRSFVKASSSSSESDFCTESCFRQTDFPAKCSCLGNAELIAWAGKCFSASFFDIVRRLGKASRVAGEGGCRLSGEFGCYLYLYLRGAVTLHIRGLSDRHAKPRNYERERRTRALLASECEDHPLQQPAVGTDQLCGGLWPVHPSYILWLPGSVDVDVTVGLPSIENGWGEWMASLV